MAQKTNPNVATGSRSPVLLADNLRKSYGATPALRGLSFSLHAGRILGLLGPNGAGKTTAIRILTTILDASSGYFSVGGIRSDYPETIRHKIGVLPESLGFPKQMTGIEFLAFYGQLYGRTAARARKTGMVLLQDVGLRDRANSLIGTYSRGMRQRLGIARALINDPTVVFLDEPTLGLDPRGQQELLSLVRRIARERNAGVVLCSHFLSEIEAVCDDVVILKSGEVVASGTVTEVMARAREKVSRSGKNGIMRIHVESSSVDEARQILESNANVLKVNITDETSGNLLIELAGPEDGNSSTNHLVSNRILDTLIRSEIPILSFAVEGRRLQDVFLELTAGDTE